MKDWFDEKVKASPGAAFPEAQGNSSGNDVTSRWAIGFPNLNLSSLSPLATSMQD
jgi:hypothetical protein